MKPSLDLSSSRIQVHDRGPALRRATRSSEHELRRNVSSAFATFDYGTPKVGHGRESVHLLETLAHAMRVRSLGNMSVDLAHEVKLPISAIIQYARGCILRLESGAVDPVILKETMSCVLQQAELAAETIRRLREFMARREPARVDLDIGLLLQQTLDLIKARAGRSQVVLRLEVVGELPRVQADEVQIKQVVLNLIQNAIEAVRGLPAVRKRVEIRAGTAESGDEVEVTITDRGPGCTPMVLQGMFEPFVTTKMEGLGMGLAISQSIVEAHGGKLWAVPNSTNGLSFHFTFPTEEGSRS